jgi:hypothetical protein
MLLFKAFAHDDLDFDGKREHHPSQQTLQKHIAVGATVRFSIELPVLSCRRFISRCCCYTTVASRRAFVWITYYCCGNNVNSNNNYL